MLSASMIGYRYLTFELERFGKGGCVWGGVTAVWLEKTGSDETMHACSRACLHTPIRSKQAFLRAGDGSPCLSSHKCSQLDMDRGDGRH